METEANPAGGAEETTRQGLTRVLGALETGNSTTVTPESSSPPDAPDAPDLEVQEPEAEPEFTVKVEGKEFRVKQSELINGYQRDSDYRAKTMALAEERRTAEQLKAAASERVQHLDAALSQVIARLEVESTSTADMEKLLETNPQEYLRQRHALETKRVELAQARIAQDNLRQQQMAEMQDAQARFIESERAKLVQVLPEWKDEAKAKAEKGQLATYLRSYGFDDQQLSQLSDHRDVVIARKAMLYDQLMSKKPAVEKKVQAAPPRAESPNAGTGTSDRNENYQQALRKLNKSGSREDGRAAIRALLG